jgi:signal transduction histidine kinase
MKDSNSVASDREMLIELVGLHARAMQRMPLVQTCLVIGFALFLYTFVGGVLFVSWGLATIGIELGRASYATAVLRRDNDIDPKRVHAFFVFLAGASGAVISLGAVLFLPHLPILHQALFGASLFAIPAAGVAVSQSSRYIVAAYSMCMLFPASATWAVLHPTQATGLALLTLLYAAVLVLVSADGEKLLLRSVTIRHERDRLVLDLEQRNADVQAAMLQAEQSAQARARVLAAASHDLRQPLHALSVYCAVLATNPDSRVLTDVSQNINQIVRSLGSLLTGLLDLSRLSSGYYVPEQQHLALEKIVADVCNEYRQSAQQKHLTLIQQLTPVKMIGDAVALGRIARNLIDNAIKYTESGEILVATHFDLSAATPMAVLSVSDTGKGIPSSELGRIFEEFYQLDNPGRDRSKGVGLGLAIVQRLCELIGATVVVDSAVGRGTCFRVTMPAVVGESTITQGVPISTADVSLRGKRIYVVDDERDILKSMSTLLSAWGIDVRAADSAPAMDEVFSQSGVPDLMIVDLRLGGSEHGALLARRLQAQYGTFPVLIVTGETSSDALREANSHGFALLQKPIAPDALHRSIAIAVR